MPELACRQAMLFVNGGVWSLANEKLTQFMDQYWTSPLVGPSSPLMEEASFGKIIALHELEDAKGFADAMQSFKTQHPESKLQPQLDWLANQPAMDSKPAPYHDADWKGRQDQYAAFLTNFPESVLAPEVEYQAAHCLYALGRDDARTSATALFKAAHPNDYRCAYLDYDAADARKRFNDWSGAHDGFEAVWQTYPRSPVAEDALREAAECLYWGQQDDRFRQAVQDYRAQYPKESIPRHRRFMRPTCRSRPASGPTHPRR